MTHDDLVKLAVNMVTQLNDVKVLLKDCRTVLEDIDVTAPLHPAPQISTQISDLQSALNDLKISKLSKPEPLDYSKLISGLEKPVKDAFKELPFQKPVVNTKKQAREVAEFQARSCNVMVYNCLRCSVNDSDFSLGCCQDLPDDMWCISSYVPTSTNFQLSSNGHG